MDGCKAMFRFGIRFNTNDYIRIIYALRRVQRVAISESKDLPRRGATDYYQIVHNNITSQKYAGGYPEYAERYAIWKAKTVGSLDFWRLYGPLLSNLRAFKVEGDLPGETAYMGGIDDSASYEGTSIAMYGMMVESGRFGKGKAVKPRPVFLPTALEYGARGWRKRSFRSLNKIRDAWR